MKESTKVDLFFICAPSLPPLLRPLLRPAVDPRLLGRTRSQTAAMRQSTKPPPVQLPMAPPSTTLPPPSDTKTALSSSYSSSPKAGLYGLSPPMIKSHTQGSATSGTIGSIAGQKPPPPTAAWGTPQHQPLKGSVSQGLFVFLLYLLEVCH